MHLVKMERIVRKDKSGKDRYVDISIEAVGANYEIVKKTGLVGGKESISRTLVKNDYTKALSRARTIWENENLKNSVLPMLAHKLEDKRKFLKFPAIVQPKIDGVRLLVTKGKAISRTGKRMPDFDHLGDELKEGEYLDGELYSPDLTFEEICSDFRTNPKILKFHIFDFFDSTRPDLPFSKRMGRTNVEVRTVNSVADIDKFHAKFVEDGHEGIMIRSPESVYEPGRRSNYLLKLKNFQDSEFKIVDVVEGTGAETGCAVYVCETNGSVFSTRPRGSHESRKKIFQNKEDYIGKMLSVRFQNMTDAGIPRFPIGLVTRDYE